MVSRMGFCCSSYKNKTTRTFEHRGEAWRVLVGAKVVLFIESTKLFDGKLFFDIDFVAFEIKRPADLSIVKRLGGFSWFKGTAFIWNSQTFLKKKAVSTSF